MTAASQLSGSVMTHRQRVMALLALGLGYAWKSFHRPSRQVPGHLARIRAQQRFLNLGHMHRLLRSLPCLHIDEEPQRGFYTPGSFQPLRKGTKYESPAKITTLVSVMLSIPRRATGWEERIRLQNSQCRCCQALLSQRTVLQAQISKQGDVLIACHASSSSLDSNAARNKISLGSLQVLLQLA